MSLQIIRSAGNNPKAVVVGILDFVASTLGYASFGQVPFLDEGHVVVHRAG